MARGGWLCMASASNMARHILINCAVVFSFGADLGFCSCIVGAGAVGTGSMDASNLLKPALASGQLRCIGATTFKEYRNNFEKDMALVRRFQKVIVEEPSEEVTLSILNGLKGYYEKINIYYTLSCI